MHLNETISHLDAAIALMGFGDYVLESYTAEELAGDIVSYVTVILPSGRNTGILGVLAAQFPNFQLISYSERFPQVLPSVVLDGVVYQFQWTDSGGGGS